jgi:hypothetical protein
MRAGICALMGLKIAGKKFGQIIRKVTRLPDLASITLVLHNPLYDWSKGDPLAWPLRPMSDTQLAVVPVDSFATPALIARAEPSTRKKFFEFLTVPQRAHTRAAYYRAVLESTSLGWRHLLRSLKAPVSTRPQLGSPR